ncbi:hypothetical protein JCM9492_05170 [Aquifex pyrophilus]
MKIFKVISKNPLWFGGLKHFTTEEHYISGINPPNIMRFFHLIPKKRGYTWCVSMG